jgi:hypothetical protein
MIPPMMPLIIKSLANHWQITAKDYCPDPSDPDSSLSKHLLIKREGIGAAVPFPPVKDYLF